MDVSQAKCNKTTVCALPSIHLPLTRKARVMVRGEGLLSFCNGCEGGSIRCNWRSKLTPLRKARGIVRVREGWCGARDGGAAIPPVVARILSGDSTSPLTREARVMVRGEGLLSFCNGCEGGSIRCNWRSKLTPLRKARGIVRVREGWCGARDGGAAIPPVVARILSGDSTSPLTREARVLVQSKG